jgi:PHD/YefM family antitoxin component YafN of YafNO toxin-antitoxin module
MAYSPKLRLNSGRYIMNLSSSVKPISYVKTHAAEVMRNICDDHDIVIVTQNGEAKVVMQNLKDYEQQQDSLAMLKIIHQSRKSIQAGEKREAKEVFSHLRNRIQVES